MLSRQQGKELGEQRSLGEEENEVSKLVAKGLCVERLSCEEDIG